MVHIGVNEAYQRLGLSQDSSLEQVKSAYKKLAIVTHPDKNPNDASATQKFQQLSEAYNALLKHLDRTSRPPPHQSGGFGAAPFGFGGFRHGFGSPYDDDDEEDDGYEGYEGYDYEGDDFEFDDDEQDAFYMFLFEEVLRGRASRYAGRQFHRMNPNMGHSRYNEETEKERKDRLLRERAESEADARRREQEEINRKVRVQEERENEMRAGAERRKTKAQTKKSKKVTEQANAATSIVNAASRAQVLRSDIFAAMRNGDAARVKKGVWEDSVDAAGPEIIGNSAGETLLHIAAGRGDIELVHWLDEHNAEVDDRDTSGYTAFHLALEKGIMPVIDYFMKTHPPDEDDNQAIYLPSPPSTSLLAMAIPDAQLVWAMLASGLMRKNNSDDIELAKEACIEPGSTREIREMLAEWGGFAPSDIFRARVEDDDEGSSDDTGSHYMTPETSVEPESPIPAKPTLLHHSAKDKGKKHHPKRSEPASTPPQPTLFSPTPTPSFQAGAGAGGPRGRGNGRGRGTRGRGRGRRGPRGGGQ
ncbi:DnaJ-domain-containing protein [Auriculariales sp. MPI-PUGE-AT-0066]|nr:DnaJ-domain-containing protein [Auriculariales sp. MPI-PUGE-AT-0066]